MMRVITLNFVNLSMKRRIAKRCGSVRSIRTSRFERHMVLVFGEQ